MSYGRKKSVTAPSSLAELSGVIFTYIFNLHWKKVCKNIKGVISDDGISNSFATSESNKRIKYDIVITSENINFKIENNLKFNTVRSKDQKIY